MTFSHQTKLWFQSWQIAFSEKNDPPVTTVLPADTAFKHRVGVDTDKLGWTVKWGCISRTLQPGSRLSCPFFPNLLLSRENRAQKCSDFGFLSPAGFANVIPIFMNLWTLLCWVFIIQFALFAENCYAMNIPCLFQTLKISRYRAQVPTLCFCLVAF